MNAINSIVINVMTEKQTIKSLTEHVLQLAAIIEQSQLEAPAPKREGLRSKGRKPRDYGPASTRKMTRWDAWDILYGNRKDQKARQIADETGLSRGQVYSVQGGYTFRDIKKDEFSDESIELAIAHNDELFRNNFVGPLPQ